MNGEQSRRRFVLGLGLVAAVGSLAGCGGNGGDGGSGGSDGEDDTDDTQTPTATPTPTPTATPTPTETPTPESDGEAAVEEYLADASNYDGTVADMTGETTVRVDVGAGGSGGGYAFDPPAIRVDQGTTIIWEWAGTGDPHNVVEEEGAFASGDPMADGTFEHTLSESGTYLYFCQPHRSLGMKGAVVVK